MDEAIAVYREAMTGEDGMRFHRKLIGLLLQSKRPDEAISICKEGILKDPNRIDLHESLAEIYAQINKDEERKAVLNDLAKLYRERVSKESLKHGWEAQLASILWELGQRDEARGLYRQRIAASRSAQNLNLFAMQMAQKLRPEDRDPDLAVEAATRALELSGYATTHILDTLATAYAASGDMASAVKWQLEAIESSTTESGRGMLGENLKMFREGKALPPDNDAPRRLRFVP